MINFENFADTIPFDNFGSSTWLYGAVIGEGSTTVVNPFATEYFAKYTQITHEWFNKGYIHRDAATQTETGFLLVRNNAALAHMNAGEFDIKASLDQRTGMDIAVLKVAEGIVNTGIMQKFTWAVPVTSRVPEAALKFLALTYTDAEVLNLINYGIEDVHYVVEADGRINWPQGVTSLTSPYFPGGNFLFGNAYLAKVRVGPVSPPDMRQQILEINQNVQTSPLLGFSVVTRTFVNELAAVANVYAQFGEGLMAGSSNPATVLPQFLAALEAAGYPRILAEVQKQVDAFKAANR